MANLGALHPSRIGAEPRWAGEVSPGAPGVGGLLRTRGRPRPRDEAVMARSGALCFSARAGTQVLITLLIRARPHPFTAVFIPVHPRPPSLHRDQGGECLGLSVFDGDYDDAMMQQRAWPCPKTNDEHKSPGREF